MAINKRLFPSKTRLLRKKPMVFVNNAVLIPLKTVVLTRGTMVMAAKKLLLAAFLRVYRVFPRVFLIIGRNSAIPDGCFWSQPARVIVNPGFRRCGAGVPFTGYSIGSRGQPMDGAVGPTID